MSKFSFKWLVLWSLWATRLIRQPTVPVLVANGLIRGSVSPDGTHLQYTGIPYAVAPHRFQSPTPEAPWLGVFEAINEHIRCPQRFGKLPFITGQENCLTLNIYTPMSAEPSSKLPVMVFVHGGGFYEGSGTPAIYGPQYLVSKGIILVTFNYRLNIQGFVCLGIKEAPGNAGLKDQVAALRWVQRNIKSFGGDPDMVTVFGESAGSASVSYHLLSPMSKGLFHRAILQSGSSLSAWALQYRPIFMASLMTKTMGYPTKDAREIYNILMQKSDYDLIITRVPRKEGNVILSEVLYVPCVESAIDGEEPFLTESPYSILSKGDYNKVPIISGFNSHEGYLFAGMENDTTIPKINFEKSIPKDLVIPDQKTREEVGKRLHELYLGGKVPSRENILEIAKFEGEVYMTYPIQEEIMLHLRSNSEPVYAYNFKYDGYRNMVKMVLGKPFKSAPGATHADDLMYMFSQFYFGAMFESNMIGKLTTMWTNFAKYGNPTPTQTSLLPVSWKATTNASVNVFAIDEQFSTEPLWDGDSLLYLRHVYSKYRRKNTRD